jgi:hypothetical protein
MEFLPIYANLKAILWWAPYGESTFKLKLKQILTAWVILTASSSTTSPLTFLRLIPLEAAA